MEVSGSTVLYKKNGATVYTNNSPTVTYPLYAIGCLFSQNQDIRAAKMSVGGATATGIIWTSITGASAEVSQWSDQSGNAIDLVYPATTRGPAYVSSDANFNSLPVVDFGTGKAMRTASGAISGLGVFTLFLVVRNTNSDTAGYPFSTMWNRTDDIGFHTLTTSGATSSYTTSLNKGGVVSQLKAGTNNWANSVTRTVMHQFTGTHASELLYINGSSSGVTSGTNTGNPGTTAKNVELWLGDEGTSNLAGRSFNVISPRFAEVILYNAVLTAGEIDQVESYLQEKYGHY